MENKVKSSFKTANKSKKKRVIGRNGVFTIRVGSELLDVMFYNDYKKVTGITEYDFMKAEKNGTKKRFRIGSKNRIHTSSVVVVNGELTDLLELKCDTVADENGFFSLVLKGTARKAIFVQDFARINHVTKAAIKKRAESKKARIELVYIKPQKSDRGICIVLLKEPKRIQQAND